jgi:hypothetical protein
MTQSMHVPRTYDVHPSVIYVQAILANFKSKTGRTVEEWSDFLREERPAEPKAWLKSKGLGTTQAGLVLQRASAKPGHAFDDTPEGYLAAAPGYVDGQYSGKKDRITHKLEVTSEADLKIARPWLQRAYERDKG